MNDLNTLRPEVREAINRTDMTVEMFDTLVTVNRDDYDIICAELLRLADDCARLVDCINAQPPTRRSLIDRAERAEAELRRLAGERDELRTAYTSASQSRDYWKECAGRAGSELAALKAKIEAAPLTTFRRAMLGTPHAWVEEKFACPEWIGKRVRLVVEE